MERPEPARPATSPALTVPAALDGALQSAAGAALGAEVTLVKGGGPPGRAAQRSMVALQLLPQGGSGSWQICAPSHSVLQESCLYPCRWSCTSHCLLMCVACSATAGAVEHDARSLEQLAAFSVLHPVA